MLAVSNFIGLGIGNLFSHDVGGSGVKITPSRFHEGVPHDSTIEQTGFSLNEVGRFARSTQLLPVIKAVMDAADDKNVTVCSKCNPEDPSDKDLEYNCNLVKNRLGDTVHVYEMNTSRLSLPKADESVGGDGVFRLDSFGVQQYSGG